MTLALFIPRKTGTAIDLGLVNPYVNFSTVMPDPLAGLYETSFSRTTDLSVLAKKQHTNRFLTAAKQHAVNSIVRGREAIQKIEQEELGGKHLTDQHIDLLLRLSGVDGG